MKSYLIRLTAVSILGAILRRLAPESGGGKTVRIGAGMLILLTAMAPLGEIDLVEAAESIVKKNYGDVLTTVPVDRTANTLMEQLITDNAEAYILDKAQALGAALTVSVTTSSSSGYPVPWSVRLSGSCSESQQEQLKKWLDEELGIPEERQEWLCM